MGQEGSGACTDGCNQPFPALLVLQHLLHSRRLREVLCPQGSSG
uniref:Uncharacterized protein n=1 Tax=Anguilla anguilla TaxID=7936 RepID=A0A0E9XL89_ANGAN